MISNWFALAKGTHAAPSADRLGLRYRVSQDFNSSLDLDEVLNRCRFDAELGHGGMGTMYRAHDTLLDRDVTSS
jgi:hypothetical protein